MPRYKDLQIRLDGSTEEFVEKIGDMIVDLLKHLDLKTVDTGMITEKNGKYGENPLRRIYVEQKKIIGPENCPSCGQELPIGKLVFCPRCGGNIIKKFSQNPYLK